MERRVVVTGLGALSPIGNNVSDFWQNAVKGVSGAASITRFDATPLSTRFACELKDFDLLNFFDKKDIRKRDLYVLYSFISTDEAVRDAGLDVDKINTERAGVIWGSGIGGIGTFFEEVENYLSDPERPRTSPFFIPKMIANMAAGELAIKYGFNGPCFTTVTACASAGNAFYDALNYIRTGKSDIIIAGGSEAAINGIGMTGFSSMKALSKRNDDPATASRPFDKDRDGFVMGEGAATLILEEYEHAKARGAKIYAEFAGASINCDAHHVTAPNPDGKHTSRLMQQAVENAKLKLEDIDHINTHGTSTPLGDIAEPKAILKAFGDHAHNISINSTKSMTGHLLGAAGAIEAIAAILALKNGIVPPTINHFTDDEEIDNKLDFTFNKAKEREVNAVLSNGFGFGGHNASVVFTKL